MNNKVLPDTITKISSTLLIPLWAKVVEMRHSNPLLKEPEAERMIQILDYDFNKFTSAKLSQVGCCARAALIDEETNRFIKTHPDAVVIELGAGLDARFERLGRPPITAWYDLDLPDVIFLRRQLLPEHGNQYIADSLFSDHWLNTLASHNKPVLLLIEGVLMYFSEAEIKLLFQNIMHYLPQATIICDLLPPAALGKSKYHDALKKMENEDRPEFKWVLKDSKTLESWFPNLKVAAEFYLSEKVGKRYPWWLRLLYHTAFGKHNYDMRIIRIELG